MECGSCGLHSMGDRRLRHRQPRQRPCVWLKIHSSRSATSTRCRCYNTALTNTLVIGIHSSTPITVVPTDIFEAVQLNAAIPIYHRLREPVPLVASLRNSEGTHAAFAVFKQCSYYECIPDVVTGNLKFDKIAIWCTFSL